MFHYGSTVQTRAHKLKLSGQAPGGKLLLFQEVPQLRSTELPSEHAHSFHVVSEWCAIFSLRAIQQRETLFLSQADEVFIVPLDQRFTPPAPSGIAEATAKLGGQTVAFPPIQQPAPLVKLMPTEPLVPVYSGFAFKMGQPGTYSTLEVSIRCCSLHTDGDMAERTAAYNRDVAWALQALDAHQQVFNQIRMGLGLPGGWAPSGALPPSVVPTQGGPSPTFQAPALYTVPTPFTPNAGWPQQ